MVTVIWNTIWCLKTSLWQVPVVSNLQPWWDGWPRLNTFLLRIWCMFVRESSYMRREENQLDANEWFIALVICSTCFTHLYAHHQEFETILVLKTHMVRNALVAGGRRSGAGQQAVCLGWGKLLKELWATKALRTICGFNTSIVSSSWWWAYKCVKHVEQITSAINHSVASSWFSSLHFSTAFWTWTNVVMNLHCQQNYAVHCNIWMAPWPLFDTHFAQIFFFQRHSLGCETHDKTVHMHYELNARMLRAILVALLDTPLCSQPVVFPNQH